MSVIAVLSSVLGFFFGLTAFIILYLTGTEDAALLALFGGLGFTLLVWPLMAFDIRRTDKRYEEFEKELSSPVLLKANGNFHLGGGKVRNGNIYLCEAGFACVCLDEKPFTLDEILFQDIELYRYDDKFHLHIVKKDGEMFVITSADVPAIIDMLRKLEHI